MDPERFTALTRAITAVLPRRSLVGALGLSAAGLSGLVEAGKKRKKRKRRKRKNKHKCGKPGRQPIKDKCCKGSVRVDGRCQRCDVCARGCAFASVQAAVEAAAAGDTIALCPGTYRGDLKITKNLTLVGAGDGAGPGNTILDGAGAGRVVEIEGGSTVTLQNLRLTGGGGTGGSGGIINRGTLALTGCTVVGNTATFVGGGIVNLATMKLINSTVSGNTATEGGGIDNFQGTVELIDSSVTANSAGSAAGGIRNEGTVICSGDSTVSGNTAGAAGSENCFDVNGGTGCATCPG